MRFPPLQTTVVAAVACALILYFTFSPSFLGLKLHGWRNDRPLHSPAPPTAPTAATPPTPPTQPPQKPGGRVLNNPYTEWFLLWRDQNYTHTLVVATMKSESVKWVDEDLADLPDLQRAVYVVDDDTAPLHTPANKGNEAMAYLSYLVDFYDDLPDVSTFMHSHSATWHNSPLLNRSSADTVRRMSLEKVVREGYFNLRCDLDPGCPISAQLNRLDESDNISRMSGIVANTMLELFPGITLPDILAQPCCGQFAVSRQAIQQHPKEYYINLRNWLIANDDPASVSGRFFEYAWQYIFTSQAVVCPNEHLCWCDAYKVCFPTDGAWHEYNTLHEAAAALQEEERGLPEEKEGEISPRRKELQVMINGLYADAETREKEAFATGSSLWGRQQVLSNGWETLKTRGLL